MKFVTDALDRQTYYTYTSAGEVESVTTASGTTNYEYDNLGRLTDLTDEQGLVTHNEYDDAGHLLKTTRNYVSSRPQNDENKYNLVTEYRYDVRGNLIAVIDTYGIITRTYYDLADRPVTVVQNLVGQTIEAVTPPAGGTGLSDENIRMDTVYDEAGNVIATIDPAGVITRTYYDQANRPVTTVQNLTGQDIGVVTPPSYSPAAPDQNIRMDTVYDANGNVIASIDTAGVITRTYYDELNRPKTIVQNLLGQDISIATPPGRGTSANIRVDMYYDANGNAIATVDPKGIITRTYYDSLNRPITVVQNLAGQAINDATPPAAGVDANVRSDTYYDKAGNVIAAVDPRGMVTRTYYDEANRPVATLQNWTGTDLYGDLSTAPAYNPAVPYENVRTTVAYNADGYRDTTTDPLDRVTKYEYNEVGQLLKVTANYLNGGVPQNDQDQRNIVTEYDYDALGRQINTTDTSGRVAVNVYDDLGRVTTVTQNYLQGQSQNYKDASGNRYNLITSYSYDVRGNQIAVTDTAGVVSRMYYDALGRSVAAVHNLVG
ncbi:RHS repeat protein, partial [bacterium]